MRTVIIYPGRFQPMLSHHRAVYNWLVQQYPHAEVYLATSNKTNSVDTPFTFLEKQSIAELHGIPRDRVLQVNSPYNANSYKFDPTSTTLIFAVGSKDADRFPFTFNESNEYAVNKSGKKQYLQPLSVYLTNPEPMSNAAYILLIPNILDFNDNVKSASSFRVLVKQQPTLSNATVLFESEFDKYNNNIFSLIYSKIKDLK